MNAFFILAIVCILSIANALVEEMSFTDLTSDQSMKVVLFHDETVAASNSALEMMESLEAAGNFAQYAFKKCTLNAVGNEGAKSAGLTGGSLFTQTPESGIEQFTGALTPESFAKFHSFRTMEVSGDKITKASDLKTIFNLASTKPVFLKMYEEWCGHCKKMKKHFQMASSDEESSVHFVEVECSAADPKVCAQFGVKGFPTVKLLALVDGEYKTYDYSGPRTAAPLADFAKDALSVASSKWESYTGEVPALNSDEL